MKGGWVGGVGGGLGSFFVSWGSLCEGEARGLPAVIHRIIDHMAAEHDTAGMFVHVLQGHHASMPEHVQQVLPCTLQLCNGIGLGEALP